MGEAAASLAKRTWKAAADESVVAGVGFGLFGVGVGAGRFDPAPSAAGVLAA